MKIHLTAAALVAVGLFCSCGQPLPKGAYRWTATALTNDSAAVTRRYQIETGGLRHLYLRHQGGVDSSALAPDMLTDERTGKAEALVNITVQPSATNTPEAVLAMTVTTRGSVARFQRELTIPAAADLRTLLTETKVAGNSAATNKTTLLRIESGGKFLELNIE